MKFYDQIRPQNVRMILITEQGGEEIEKIEKTIAGLHDEICSKHSSRRGVPMFFKGRQEEEATQIPAYIVRVGYCTVLLYYIVMYCTSPY